MHSRLGLKGNEALVPVEGGEYVKEAKIGRAVMDADKIFISLAHFKGHEATGFGESLKMLVWDAALGLVKWNSTALESLT